MASSITVEQINFVAGQGTLFLKEINFVMGAGTRTCEEIIFVYQDDIPKNLKRTMILIRDKI